MNDRSKIEPVVNEPKKKKPFFWLIYVALFLSGLLLLGEAATIGLLQKWTARLGIALLFSAIALVIANGRKSGIIATGIVWAAVIILLFI